MEKSYHSHPLILTLLALIALNLFLIDLKLFSPESSVKLSDMAITAPIIPPVANINSDTAICPASCTSLLYSELNAKIATLSGMGSDIQGTKSLILNKITRENFVPLGSGSTDKTDWDNLTASETIIDPGNYGNIREVYFIVSLKNPTQNGQVDAQLYNVTDKHPVWGSHVVMNGPLSQTINSSNISFDTGAKLYRVQLKSSLGYSVSVENAKIRIISE